MVLWFTGQPGSGKTTLTNRFIDDKLIGFMKIQPVRIVHIDGDDLREIVDNKDYMILIKISGLVAHLDRAQDS